MENSKLTTGTLDTLTKLLSERVLSEIYQKIKNEQGDLKSNLFKEQLGKGISALHSAITIVNDGKGYLDTLPPYPNRHYAHQAGWQSLIHNELLKFNSKGSAYLTSVSECLIKTLGLINIHQSAYTRTLAYYRGQVDAKWEIQSSIGLKIPIKDIPTDRGKVSQFELDALKNWQSKVLGDSSITKEVFSGLLPFKIDNPEWWALKQHYDDDPITGGSRLIDWTSSPLCGLYFASVNWDGSVDENVDGGLYVMMNGLGRMFASDEYISKLKNFDEGFYDKSGSTVQEYFSLTNRLEYPRTVITESENTRQISQDGHFIFQTEFEKPITNWAGHKPFFFVIPGKSKKDILRELYSLGYTPKKIIRGKKGIDAHNKLKKELDIVD